MWGQRFRGLVSNIQPIQPSNYNRPTPFYYSGYPVYRPWRYYTNYGPSYVQMPSQECWIPINALDIFGIDLLMVPIQQWKDWAYRNGFTAIAVPRRGKYIGKHIWACFTGYCPYGQESIPFHKFDVYPVSPYSV
jgi:hypothetical protein